MKTDSKTKQARTLFTQAFTSHSPMPGFRIQSLPWSDKLNGRKTRHMNAIKMRAFNCNAEEVQTQLETLRKSLSEIGASVRDDSIHYKVRGDYVDITVRMHVPARSGLL